VFHKPGDTITDNSYPNQVIIPYNTDLTNFNKGTFCQSLIDHTTMNNPNSNLYQTITNGQKYSTTMKTLVCDDISPKTTNTLFAVYYTSYIKTNLSEVTDNFGKKILIQYFCTNESYPAIQISTCNSILASSIFYIQYQQAIPKR
jgi:hypothetical protein